VTSSWVTKRAKAGIPISVSSARTSSKAIERTHTN
jgi:hypothetical protein